MLRDSIDLRFRRFQRQMSPGSESAALRFDCSEIQLMSDSTDATSNLCEI